MLLAKVNETCRCRFLRRHWSKDILRHFSQNLGNSLGNGGIRYYVTFAFALGIRELPVKPRRCKYDFLKISIYLSLTIPILFYQKLGNIQTPKIYLLGILGKTRFFSNKEAQELVNSI